MRTGGYTLQQSLTHEAASIVKQAVSIARRRGHSQVTPLHVASAMLASSLGLFRRACLQSHSHPLQCKALELCFNVALNRLPTNTSSPLLGHQPHLPSLSNALVAAFKRAQAYQRRGSIENQQQSILALKVEIDQLVISILDDPSVSRVMREAGFSSTQVKTNVERALSLDVCSHSPAMSVQSKEDIKPKPLLLGTSMQQINPTTSSQFKLSLSKTVAQVNDDDVTCVIEFMLNKNRKNTVIVGECLATAESVVKEVIDKFDKKDVPPEIKSVQFISVPLFTLRNVSREVFLQKLHELKVLIRTCASRGVVLYLGDLNWVSEFWTKYGEQSRGYYSPVQYMIMELSRLFCGGGEEKKLWIMGIATFHTYKKCKTGRPSLDTLWNLHPLTIPVGSLALSLNMKSDVQDKLESNAERDGFGCLFSKAGVEKRLTCCSDCSVNFKREAQGLIRPKIDSKMISSSSSLPTWLQQYKAESVKQSTIDQDLQEIKDLCNKWNSICTSVHGQPHFLEKPFNLSTSSPASSNSITSNSKMHKTILNWPVIFEPTKSPKEHQFLTFENEAEVSKPDFTKPDLLSNPNSSPNSASSSEASGDMGFLNKFKEFNPENLKILSSALEKKVPWQRDILPDIARTILECRSGKVRKTNNKHDGEREDTWMFFLGADSEGKEKIARELSQVVFGSQDHFTSIGLSSFASTRGDSSEEVVSNKRTRDEHGGSYFERFVEKIRDNPNRVFFLEDIDEVNYHSVKGIKEAMEDGRIASPDGELVPLEDAIVIFSSESKPCSPPIENKLDDKDKEKEENDGIEKQDNGLLDLNIATEDETGDEQLVSDNGILDLVDKQVVFKIQVS